MNNFFNTFKKPPKSRGIQPIIMGAFTLSSVFILLVIGIIMYFRFSAMSLQEIIDNTSKQVEQTADNLEDYLYNMRQISDVAYYNIIKEKDVEDTELQSGINLIYEANKDSIRSIALYDSYGRLLIAEPIASEKNSPQITNQEWYIKAVGEVENMHFSTPHIQNLFDDSTYNYYRVISLSRAVEIIKDDKSGMGVLLVDMDYDSISSIMEKLNAQSRGQYFYLCDAKGDIIYHPRQIQIKEGLFEENNLAVADYSKGVFEEVFNKEHRQIMVDTVSYTGWKIVGVIPKDSLRDRIGSIRLFIILLFILMVMTVLLINRLITNRISKPLLRLNDSVLQYESGEKPRIYIGGPIEIRHLGESIQAYYTEIELLMKRFRNEQNERRKSELDALQSQINPHFLYNTLDSIIWMVEDERNEEASFMISELAKLFRISLSKGNTVITIRDELQHAKSYLNIQKVRYKDTFNVEYDISEDILDKCTVKLILQPILENAIYYGVNDPGEDGVIKISGRMEGDDIFISISDNGMGMTKEEVAGVLSETNSKPKKGSGVGLVNVNNRIKIMFGEEYGLIVESELDEGTTVTVHLPGIFYSEEKRIDIEKGRGFLEE